MLASLADPTSANIYLSNLPFHWGEEDVKALFGNTPIASARLLRDRDDEAVGSGASRGVGFVRLACRADALHFVELLHGMPIPGTKCHLQCRMADSQAQKEWKRNVRSSFQQELNVEASTSPPTNHEGWSRDGIPAEIPKLKWRNKKLTQKSYSTPGNYMTTSERRRTSKNKSGYDQLAGRGFHLVGLPGSTGPGFLMPGFHPAHGGSPLPGGGLANRRMITAGGTGPYNDPSSLQPLFPLGPATPLLPFYHPPPAPGWYHPSASSPSLNFSPASSEAPPSSSLGSPQTPTTFPSSTWPGPPNSEFFEKSTAYYVYRHHELYQPPMTSHHLPPPPPPLPLPHLYHQRDDFSAPNIPQPTTTTIHHQKIPLDGPPPTHNSSNQTMISTTTTTTTVDQELYSSTDQTKRILSFVKRVVQILPYHQPPFICSAIVLLGHLFSTNTNCSKLFSKRPETEELAEKDQYDGRKRDPSYANADKSCLWELVPLLSHYHPAVSLNASQLLSAEPISSSVDLTHHTLSNFLDKFVYRQPKKNLTQKGSSIMQPDLHYRLADVVKRRANHQTSLDQNVPVNSKSFLSRKGEEIPADEVFFHKFFQKKEIIELKHKKQKERQKSKKSITEDNDFGGKGGSDDGSSEDEAEEGSALPGYDDDDKSTEENDEDEVWAAMKSSMGKELKRAMPDDESEDEWSGMDPAEFEDSDDDSEDGKLKQLLADEEDDEVSSDIPDDPPGSSFDNEEISVSGLDDDDDDDENPSAEEEDSEAEISSLKNTIDSRKRKPSSSLVNPPKKSTTKSDNGRASKKRKTWKTLPTFASADDYQHLLSDPESSN